MAERNLDFDREIVRRGTGCIKYDCALEFGKPEDVLPLWVADVFLCAGCHAGARGTRHFRLYGGGSRLL